MPTITERIRHGWNAFINGDRIEEESYREIGSISYQRPDRIRLSGGRDKSIVTTIYNRLALDIASIDIKHVRLDENGRYADDISSGLNYCLTVESNIDQTSRACRQDVAMSLFDEGCIAIVPTEGDIGPDGYFRDITSIRVGKIIEWRPKYVKVRLYNETKGEKQDILLPKTLVAIVENPLYAIMNEPNSTMQRLTRTLALLDRQNEELSSGKLDLIIQLPYVVKSDKRREQAEKRRKDIEMQLTGSKYGIAYTDGTEHITQLNRSLENNLMAHVEYLTNMLFSQLGMTQSILDGTADEQTMLNYNNRTIEPIISAIVDEMNRKFLSRKAREENEAIRFFRNPFKLVPVNNLAEIADKFTRNEIMSSNEFRQIVGLKPSDDPEADELRNKNLNKSKNEETPEKESRPKTKDNTE